MQNILEIKNLKFKWNVKDYFLLKIKKFTIQKNKKVIMFGNSGSGKSTLLNLISGILKPCSGTIKIDDTIINNLNQRMGDSFRANNIGVIFQQFNILNYISPLTNILLPSHFTNSGNKNIKSFYLRAFDLAEKLNLSHKILLQSNSVELSVGQKQRIAIIRSIINNPKLILADEPTSALDEDNKKKFLKLLLNICEYQKIGLLMVSHDKSIEQYFDAKVQIDTLNKDK